MSYLRKYKNFLVKFFGSVVVGLFVAWIISGFFVFDTLYGYTSFRESQKNRFDGEIDRHDPVIPDRECMFTQEEPLGDGDNASRIQKVIDACSENGGGVVRIPAGTWSTGPIELKSQVRVYLEEEAILSFDPDVAKYERAIKNRFEGIEMMGTTPLIYAQDCIDVALSGEGTIEGSGSVWQGRTGWTDQHELFGQLWWEGFIFDRLTEMVSMGMDPNDRKFAHREVMPRPDMVLMRGCNRVAIEGVTFHDMPRWGLHFLYSQSVLVRGIHIDTEGENTDGIVIDSSHDVLVEDVDIHSGDDAIVMKSGLDQDGLRVNIPTERVVIHDARIDGAHGGVVIGSEMSGGVQNVLAYDCSVRNAWVAGRIKAPKGRGGFVRFITMKDFSYEHIKDNAIHVNMEYAYNVTEEDVVDIDTIPLVSNLYFSNFHGKDAGRIVDVDGLEQKPVENILFENLAMQGEKGIALQNVSGVIIRKSSFNIDFGRIKKKNFVTFENADRIFIEDLDCGSVKSSKCVGVSGNNDKKSIVFLRTYELPVNHNGNIRLGTGKLPLPFGWMFW